MLRVLRPWTQKVLKMDRLICRRDRKFDGAFGPKGCGFPWGHFVARVHRVQRGRLTGLRPEGCVEGLHRFAQGATAPAALRVADCRTAAMLIKSALRIHLSVSYVMKSITSISHLRWLCPFGALRHHLPPAERWDNKDPQSSPFISSSQHNGAL